MSTESALQKYYHTGMIYTLEAEEGVNNYLEIELVMVTMEMVTQKRGV